MWGIAGIICIVIGFFVGVAESKFVFESLVWFVAAIAFNTLNWDPRHPFSDAA